MIPTPTLRQLRYFLATADSLSFSQAAATCHVTQSTLSGGINDLETLLGEKLFTRTSRTVALTAIGKDMVEPARALMANAEDFVQRAKKNHPPLSGPLRLGVIPTIAPYLLPILLPKLHAKFPALDLQLREDLTARLLEDLHKNQLDAVLMAFPYDENGLEKMPLWDEPFFLVAAGRKKPNDKPAHLDDLKGQDVLLLDDGHCLRDHAMAACRLQSPAQRQTFGATSLPTLIQMVRHGYGVTLLPEMAIDSKTSTGLSIRRFANPQPTRQIGLAWRKGSPRMNEFKLLGDFIAKNGQAG